MGIDPNRSLEYRFPEIAKEWHPTLNHPSKPIDVSYGSNKEVWWKCLKEENHIWKKTIKARTLNKGQNCPVCNSLAFKFPEIAKEIHRKLNFPLTPELISFGSGKKIWWQCPKFENHIYQAAPSSRTRKDGRGTSCPYCSNQSSIPEIRILSELETIFKNVVSKKRIKGKEIDIFLPDINVGIEYDGYYFHKNSNASDQRKNKVLNSENVFIIRLREKPLKQIDKNDILISDAIQKSDINEILKVISNNKKVDQKFLIQSFEIYERFNNFRNTSIFKEYLNHFPSPLPQHSIVKTHPEIANQWHKEKNKPLKPINFSYGSTLKVWWQCPEVKNHFWQATIQSRTGTYKTGCPFCNGKMKVSPERSLATLSPDIAKEWHPTRNAPLEPEDVFNSSHKKVWWQCPEVKDHFYSSSIKCRTGKDKTGCPFCNGKMKVSPERSLATLSPDIAKEWHPTRNAPLKPEDVFNGSNKKVWWQCQKVKTHIYLARIADRKKKGCTFCKGTSKVSFERSLATLSPDIAKEWHPTRNAPLKPEDVFNSSHKKVWWQCRNNKEHEWESRIIDRTRQGKRRTKGCKICN